jgi:hypothetical protein
MTASPSNPQTILPSVPCSRNLRRRTGVWMGLQAWEITICLCLSMIPDFLFRMGILQKPHLFLGILISALAMGFFVLFHRNKPPNYFSLWMHHHFLHPSGWRATRSATGERFPICEEPTPEPNDPQ